MGKKEEEEGKCGSEAFLGRRLVFGPRVGRDWQMAADLRKQLIIPQETLSTGFQSSCGQRSNKLFTWWSWQSHVRMWLMRLEGKMLRCTEAAEAVRWDRKNIVRHMKEGCEGDVRRLVVLISKYGISGVTRELWQHWSEEVNVSKYSITGFIPDGSSASQSCRILGGYWVVLSTEHETPELFLLRFSTLGKA